MDHLDKMEILQILSMEKYIPARKLAEKSKIGEKTLRKRMKELKEELERNGASIEIKHGQGYRLKLSSIMISERISPRLTLSAQTF